MATINKRMQFTNLVDRVLVYTGTLDLGNAATGSGTFASADVTVTGVAFGDVVIGVSLGVDTVDTAVIGAVTAANTVTVTVLNNTAGAVNLASTTVRIVVLRLAGEVSFV